MAFINVISPTQSDGRLAKIYKRIQAPDGQVDNVLQVHSLRPHTLEGHMALYKAVLHHTSNQLQEWYLEAVGVLVSTLNGCRYCALHHSAGMERLLKAASLDHEAYSAALKKNEPGVPFTPREQAGLIYARKLTRSPGQVKPEDIEILREAGYEDGEILELNQVSAYFAYANRTVSGLGVNTDDEVIGQSPATGDDEAGWSHG
jgi:uncharacterized peroxidase-related enzyme